MKDPKCLMYFSHPLLFSSFSLVRSEDQALRASHRSTAAAGPGAVSPYIYVHACASGEDAAVGSVCQTWQQLSELSWQEGVENVGKEERSQSDSVAVCIEIRPGSSASPAPWFRCLLKSPSIQCWALNPYMLLALFCFLLRRTVAL